MSEADVAAAPGRSSRKRLLLIIGSIVILSAALAGCWFSGLLPKLLGHGGKHGAQVASVAEKPVLVDLPDVLANLDTAGRRASFIKLKSKLQVPHAADVAAVQAAMPQILDLFQTYLRSMRPDELHGGEGTYRLRETLMSRLDALLSPVQVSDLLFTEMLIQ
jgi:flagellar protein FliL